MKERRITLVCALGALALFATLFLGGADEQRDRDVSRPTTEERGRNGYYGAMAWLYQERIRTFSVRDRFGKLADDPRLAPKGNLLIVTLPATAAFRKDEFPALERWIRAGNTMLVLAALSDNPDWAAALGGFASGDLNRLTGLEFDRVSGGRSVAAAGTGGDRGVQERNPGGRGAAAGSPGTGARGAVDSRIADAARAFAHPQHGSLIPNRPHAYFEGVREALAVSDYPAQSWEVRVPRDGFVLSLAHEKETGDGVFWTRALGSGRIVVSGFGSLFTNRAVGLGDNARLLANLVGGCLGPRGAVLFDDVHQGLGASYDPSRFYQDSRLYVTLAILAGLWLAWVLGSTRLRMPAGRVPAPTELDFVRATGLFLARVLRADAGARRMLDGFLQRVAVRAKPDVMWGTSAVARGPDAVAWEWLERQPRVSREDVQQLRVWYSAAQASRRVPLVRLHNLIVRLERTLK
jgi:hypothetical protein